MSLTGRVFVSGGGGMNQSGKCGDSTKWKRSAVAFSVLMIGAVLSPVIKNWKKNPKDDFPLSHYPMFSKKRLEVAGVTYLVGFDAHGDRHKIPYRWVGEGGLNQVRKQIGKRVENGDAVKLCESVASKIAAMGDPVASKIVSLQIRSGKYNLTDYFTRQKDPVEEKTRARCRVIRSGQ